MANDAGWTLVTGASEGIGLELARVAAKSGRSVILAARQAEKLNALAEELRGKHNVGVDVIPADLSTEAGAEALWEAATADGRRIDFLINNAGLGSNGPFAEPATWERERASVMVNVLALTILMKRAVPHMAEHGRGRILNVASVAGFMA
ncbi:MAG: SDR family NAD(P)-dependent oxidoreductase, partial [Pseudomonadota bacterium]